MPPRNDDRRERAKALHALEFSFRQIASMMQVNESTVRRWLSDRRQAYDKAYRRNRTEYHREYKRKQRARKSLA